MRAGAHFTLSVVAIVVAIMPACKTTKPLVPVDRSFSEDERAACESLLRARYRHESVDCPVTSRLVYGMTEDDYVWEQLPECELGYFTSGSNVTPSLLRACATEIAATDCHVSEGDLLPLEYVPACDLPAGSFSDGTACSHDWQCAGGSCAIPLGSVKDALDNWEKCGTCERARQLGEPCTRQVKTVTCAAGLVCSGAGVCTKRFYVERNGACRETVDCASGLVCKSTGCGDPDPVGAPCSAGACAIGFYCPPTTPTTAAACKPLLPLGARCEGPGTCATGSICNGLYDCMASSEYRPAPPAGSKAGESCSVHGGQTTGYYSSCIAPTVCVENQCVYFDPEWCVTNPDRNTLHVSQPL